MRLRLRFCRMIWWQCWRWRWGIMIMSNYPSRMSFHLVHSSLSHWEYQYLHLFSAPNDRITGFLKAHLIQYSTGLKHPKATRPILEIGHTLDIRRHQKISMVISGSSLFVAQAYDDSKEPYGLVLSVFDWERGELIMVSYMRLIPSGFWIVNKSFFDLSEKNPLRGSRVRLTPPTYICCYDPQGRRPSFLRNRPHLWRFGNPNSRTQRPRTPQASSRSLLRVRSHQTLSATKHLFSYTSI